MIKKYSWQHRNADFTYQCVPTENTGDGINMALEVGADTMNIPCARGKQLTTHSSGAGMQPCLWINKWGQRFANEEMAFSFMNAGSSIIKQPECVMYSILDAEQVRRCIEEGSEMGLGDFIEYKQKLTRLQTELDQDVAEGIAWKGDTIEELAKAIGDVDQEAMVKTFNEYNEFCDKGDDPMFFKQKAYLRPLRKPPFYAINMAASVLVSTGALRVNGDMQVTDEKYKPIPGLYAAGHDAGGLYGDAYNLDVPGTANGFAHASGRVAARHAIKTIKG